MGKKKLVSLGFNYRYYSDKIIKPLNGPPNSARDFANFLVDNHEFKESDITLITDDVDPQNIPQASEILRILQEEFKNPEPGDTMVLYMSGHGARMPSPGYYNNSGFVEFFICGGPKNENGVRSSTMTTYLTDVDLRVACTVPNGCNITVIADCCNSGGIVEGLNEIAGVSTSCPTTGKLDMITSPPSNAILFSACQSGDVTGEVHIPSRGKFVAYLTKKLITASKSLGRFQSNKQIYYGIMATLDKRTYILPGLYCNPAQMNMQFLGNEEFISKIEWPIIEYKTLLQGSNVISTAELRESFAILKDDWPGRWKKFNDLVSATIQSEEDSVNCMQILKSLLSMKFFDFSGGEMTEQEKQSMNREFQLIHELCLYLLSTSQSGDVICAALSTFQGFISRIPLHSIIASSTVETLVKLFQDAKFRVHTLPCLTEVASLQVGDFFDVLHVKMHGMVVNEIQIRTPPTINTPEAYEHVSSSEKAFIQNLALFFTSFYKVHIRILEENRATLQLGLDCLIHLSYVDDIGIFMVCLNYWKSLVSELLDDSAPQVHERQQIYISTMSKLRTLMISRMAKPDEFLLIEDDNGNIVRETLTDSDVLDQYKIMRETLIGLVHLDRVDTKNQMLQRLGEQLRAVKWKLNNYQWDTLNTLCWAIGSISGSFENVKEKNMFCAVVIPDLLKLCELMKGTKNKAVMASNFMYVLGQYRGIDLRYYEDIIHMLLKFMVETCPAVQDMACEIFLEAAQNFKFVTVTQVHENEESFVSKILSCLPARTADLEPHNVHSFYESVAHMIQAESDSSKRDEYLQLLMDIPNKKWDDLIHMAASNTETVPQYLLHIFLNDQNVTRDLFHILQINTSVASSLGKFFLPQLSGDFYEGILWVYRQCSILISKSISEGRSYKSKALKLLCSIRREILKLFETCLEKDECLEVKPVGLLQYLGDDYVDNVPGARELEVLSLFATTVKKYATVEKFKATITVATDIMRKAVTCIIEMDKINHVDYPEHWLKLSSLLGDIAAHCLPALLKLEDKELNLVMQSILLSFQHKEWNIHETSLKLLLDMLNQIKDKTLFDQFFSTNFWNIVDHIFMSLRDTFPEHGVNLHARVFHRLFFLHAVNSYRDHLSHTIKFRSSFQNTAKAEVQEFFGSLFASIHDFSSFETSLKKLLDPVQDMEWSAERERENEREGQIIY